MKKLVFVSILLTFLTAAAFAQFTASVWVEFQGDILRTAAPLDRARDTSKTDPFTGEMGYEKRYFNFMSSADYWKGSEIWLDLSYTDPNNKDDPKYGGFLEVGYDSGVIDLFTKTDSNFWDVVLKAPVGEWNAWGKVGIFKGFVGNSENLGATGDGRYNHYNDFMDNFKFENFGMMRYAVPKMVDGVFTKDYMDYELVDLMTGYGSYVSVEADLAPITVAIAGDLTGISVLNDAWGTTQDTLDSHTGIGAGFRVSGDVFDMLKFDAIYKIIGGEQITDENQGRTSAAQGAANSQPNGDGFWVNSFGLYGNVNLLNDTLGLTAGYSGSFMVRENKKENEKTIQYESPYYSGIDLRAHFSGIDKLKVSLHNNFTFSYIKGKTSDNATEYRIGRVADVDGLDLNHSDKTEGYFGMYNALLVDYNLTEDLLASFQVGNRWYSYTHTDKSYTSNTNDVITTMNADELQLTAAAFYSLGDHVTLGSGLAFNLYHQTLTKTNSNFDDEKAGFFTFGIPLTVRVVY